MGKNKIEIKNLSKAFNGKIVLNNLNLSVGNGESLVILGRSGVGKSVLIKILSTLMEPDAGSIKIDGAEITAYGKKQRDALMEQFGFLFQGSALFDSMTVWENTAFKLLNNLRLPRETAKQMAIEKLKLVDICGDIVDLLPSELSGGMQKRVALARAIMGNPAIIFFDEPTTGLDPVTANTINKLIVKIKKITGVTAVTITHDVKSAMEIADRIILLNNGAVEWEGAPEELAGCDNQLLREFVGYGALKN
ncbi:MAG: ATP-binding cassette domain-containing protein [Rickettsiales bacterium]|nr:ATP-binding cassette domain-containing protein [Rickettsiales bacterium]